MAISAKGFQAVDLDVRPYLSEVVITCDENGDRPLVYFDDDGLYRVHTADGSQKAAAL
jgi:hypothetical protein